jgi:hypothetical protein
LHFNYFFDKTFCNNVQRHGSWGFRLLPTDKLLVPRGYLSKFWCENFGAVWRPSLKPMKIYRQIWNGNGNW